MIVHADCLGALLAAGVDVDFRNNDGVLAIYYAAQEGRVVCLRALLAAGADVNASCGKGNCTALMMAALPPRGVSAGPACGERQIREKEQ